MNNFIFKILDKTVDICCIIAMGMLTVGVIVLVFMRYILSVSFAWSEELITMLFIFTSFFGCVLATKNNDHINVPFLLENINPAGKLILKIIIILIGIFVQAVILKFSIGWISVVGNTLTPGMQLPFYFFYFFMPVSAGLIILYECIRMMNIIHEFRNGGL